jgi:hypothetical protein
MDGCKLLDFSWLYFWGGIGVVLMCRWVDVLMCRFVDVPMGGWVDVPIC